MPRKPRTKEPEILSEDNKLELLRRIATYETDCEIVHWAKDNGLRIGYTSVKHYRHAPKWKPFIYKVRNEYATAILEVPIANKRKRLERLEEMFQTFKEKGRLRDALAVLGEARNELETKRGDITNIVFNQLNQYNNLTDEEIEQKMATLADQLKSIRRNGKPVLELDSSDLKVEKQEEPYAGETGTPVEISSKEKGTVR